MQNIAKSMVALAVGGVSLLALVGCSAVSHVSAQLRDGVVRFVYCESYAPTEINVSISPTSHRSMDWVEVWAASGALLQKEVPVSYGVPPAGVVSTSGPIAFEPAKSNIEVAFKDLSPSARGPYMVGDFDGRKLVEGKWLDWNGNVVDTPCAG